MKKVSLHWDGPVAPVRLSYNLAAGELSKGGLYFLWMQFDSGIQPIYLGKERKNRFRRLEQHFSYFLGGAYRLPDPTRGVDARGRPCHWLYEPHGENGRNLDNQLTFYANLELHQRHSREVFHALRLFYTVEEISPGLLANLEAIEKSLIYQLKQKRWLYNGTAYKPKPDELLEISHEGAETVHSIFAS